MTTGPASIEDRDEPVPRPARPTWASLLPAWRAGLVVVVLFGVSLWLVRHYAAPLAGLLQAHLAAGAVAFFVSSVLAVLLPVLSNLPLVPLAVLAWGPAATALVLLGGWVLGAALSFMLGRHARAAVLRLFPSVARHADIERLIDPRRRLLSLAVLRATFPVDVLSYALGLFSARTTLAEVVASTLLGAAPFAVLFALFPALDGAVQWTLFGASVLAFAAWTTWRLRRRP